MEANIVYAQNTKIDMCGNSIDIIMQQVVHIHEMKIIIIIKTKI